jgi:hypothetical protein
MQDRLEVKRVLESPYFMNTYIETMLFLENIALKDPSEKDVFFK